MVHTRHALHRLMLPTRSTRVVVVALAVLAVACGDLTRPKASTPNIALSPAIVTTEAVRQTRGSYAVELEKALAGFSSVD